MLSIPQLPKRHPGLPRWQLDKTLWRRQWMSASVLGVEGKASLSLPSKDGKVTLATKYPPQTPSSPKPWCSGSWTCSFWTFNFLTSISWTSSSWRDLQLLVRPLAIGPPAPEFPGPGPPAPGPCALRQRQCGPGRLIKRGTGLGQTSTNPATAPFMPSVPNISEQNFKCNLCEHSFKNHKGLKIHNWKKSESYISPRKEHSTFVSQETIYVNISKITLMNIKWKHGNQELNVAKATRKSQEKSNIIRNLVSLSEMLCYECNQLVSIV